MKAAINIGLILSGALLISMPSFSQVETDHLLNKSKTAAMEVSQNLDNNKAAVRKLYEEILNTGKLELLNQVIGEEYVGGLGEKGPAGFAEAITPVRNAFPDIKWTIEDLIAEGNEVMVRWSWKGTNKGSFNGFPASNKVVTHHAISIFQFSAGKIIGTWMQSDRLGFFQQIGVIAPDAIKPPAKK
ncbi:steroid delta-isomerase-like uncharacterized protein [Chitinophaga niastensis]|uniref:Steroid delta-isomerase-like uncharacterized protein n=1 Tax=Chitinophaga niastensis TaxID=536980 RepID=A0A2P8HCA2_CHINA|nr:ester cyclase [Chitinophaga niastensis]PSL43857.1 steroid delta-isomerase-like uncharacterized protein [Chitinophaga niastensis]